MTIVFFIFGLCVAVVGELIEKKTVKQSLTCFTGIFFLFLMIVPGIGDCFTLWGELVSAEDDASCPHYIASSEIFAVVMLGGFVSGTFIGKVMDKKLET